LSGALIARAASHLPSHHFLKGFNCSCRHRGCGKSFSFRAAHGGQKICQWFQQVASTSQLADDLFCMGGCVACKSMGGGGGSAVAQLLHAA
jgi:hypothetical protein